MKLWLNSTGQLICDTVSGAPLLCDDCPCPHGCEELQAEILKRQQVNLYPYGAWNPASPAFTGNFIATWAQKSDYSIAEYKDYVNQFAALFVDGLYTGGASQPTMLTGSYANSATDCDELYDLVADMVTTKPAISTNSSIVAGYGESGAQASEAAAIAAAQADWTVGASSGADLYAYARTYWEGADYYATIAVKGRTWTQNNMATVVSKTLKFWGRYEQFDVLNAQGQAGVPATNLHYGAFEEAALAAATTTHSTASPYADTAIQPPNFAWNGGEFGGEMKLGWKIPTAGSYMFATITWDF